MEYDIKDVVYVPGVTGAGFYGVIAGRTLLPSGMLDYDVAPLDGKSLWRVSAERLRPSDKSFAPAAVETVLAAFARDRRLPQRLSLSNYNYGILLRVGVVDIEGGYKIAFEAHSLTAPSGSVSLDRILGIYWTGPK